MCGKVVTNGTCYGILVLKETLHKARLTALHSVPFTKSDSPMQIWIRADQKNRLTCEYPAVVSA